MSVLLIAPAFGLILLASTGLLHTIRLGLIIVGVQVSFRPTQGEYSRRTDADRWCVEMSMGLPFLLKDWHAYLSRAFELTRVFIPFWSVNWRFLPDDVFLSSKFAVLLLALHATTLTLAARQWCKPLGGFQSLIRRTFRHPGQPASLTKTPSAECKFFVPVSRRDLRNFMLRIRVDIITVVFSCNIIGMLFARSLHYQFYAWEAHQIVFLLWQTRLPLLAK